MSRIVFFSSEHILLLLLMVNHFHFSSSPLSPSLWIWCFEKSYPRLSPHHTLLTLKRIALHGSPSPTTVPTRTPSTGAPLSPTSQSASLASPVLPSHSPCLILWQPAQILLLGCVLFPCFQVPHAPVLQHKLSTPLWRPEQFLERM